MRLIPHGIELPDRYGEWVLSHRLPIIALIALVTAITSLKTMQMPVQRSLIRAILSDPSEYNEYRRKIALFGHDSDDLILVATNEGDSLFTPKKLDAIRQVARQLTARPEIGSVTCLPDAWYAPSPTRFSLRQMAARSLLRRQIINGTLDPQRDQNINVRICWPKTKAAQHKINLAEVQEAMLRDKGTAGRMLSSDGSAQIMIIELVSAADTPLAIQMQLEQTITKSLRDRGLGKNGIYIAGLTVSQGWMFREVGRALTLFFPMGMVIICVTVYALFRQLTVVVLTAVIGLISVVWGIGTAAFVFGELTVLVAAAPLVVLVISTSDVIHLTTAYRNELRQGLAREEALRKVIREVGGACILTSVSTFVGFLSLIAVPTPTIRHLAVAVAVGVASAMMLALTIVPMAYSLMRPPPTNESYLLALGHRLIGRLIELLQGISLRYSRTVVTVCAVLCLAGFIAAGQMRVDMDFPQRFAADHPLRQSFDFFKQQSAGASAVEVFIRGGAHSLVEPDALRAIDRFERRLSAIPEISSVHSILIPYRALHELLWFQTTDSLPPTSLAAATCLTLFRQIDSTAIDSLITSSHELTRVTVQTTSSGYLEVSQIADRIDEIARQTLPASFAVETTGSYPIIGRLVQIIVSAQLIGLATCFVVISLILVVEVRSIRIAMLAQIPNMLPAILLLGIVSLTWDPVDADLLGISTVALGLAVDDTIHFLHRYQLQRTKQDRPAALQATYAYTGRAIMQTTLILCFGLLPFALSAFLSVWMLGTYLVMTLLCAVLGDLLLLPAMIHLGILER